VVRTSFAFDAVAAVAVGVAAPSRLVVAMVALRSVAEEELLAVVSGDVAAAVEVVAVMAVAVVAMAVAAVAAPVLVPFESVRASSHLYPHWYQRC